MSTKIQSESSGTQQATPTAEETEMNKLRLEQYKGLQPQESQYYSNAYNLANQMMTGGQLPGTLGGLAGGLSPEVIGNQAALYTKQNMPGFQSLGLADSGVAANQMARGIANEVLLPTSEYNSNLLLNMLNLATGQSAQGTNQFTAGSSQLAGQLAGLRSYQTTGSQTQTRNPFLESFYSGLGSSLGTGTFGNTGGWFGK